MGHWAKKIMGKEDWFERATCDLYDFLYFINLVLSVLINAVRSLTGFRELDCEFPILPIRMLIRKGKLVVSFA